MTTANENRRILATLELLYKYRVIPKEIVMNVLWADWCTAYRTLTGVVRDKTLDTKLKLTRNSFPTFMEKIEKIANTSEPIGEIQEAMWHYKKDVLESYENDISLLENTYLTK